MAARRHKRAMKINPFRCQRRLDSFGLQRGINSLHRGFLKEADDQSAGPESAILENTSDFRTAH
jgi:hypothetical protein